MSEPLYRPVLVLATGEWEWELAVQGDPVTLPSEFTPQVGHRTNGASVPRFMRALLGHPCDADLFEPAFHHDVAYRVGMARFLADDLFYARLIRNGVQPWRARLLHLGVRVFGWLYWRRCRYGRGING